MDLNNEKRHAINVLGNIKPSWRETNEPQSAISIATTALAMVKPVMEDAEAQTTNNAMIDTMDIEHLERTAGGSSGVYRQPATKTKITFNVSASQNVAITHDNFACQMQNGTVLAPILTNNLQEGDNQVDFECVDTGPIEIINSAITITKPLAGVDGVTYIEPPYYIGTNIQSEESYRIMCRRAKSRGGTTEGNLEQRLLSNAGCTRAWAIYRNESDLGYIKAHTYGVICYGGDEDKIFEEISKTFLMESYSIRPEQGKSKEKTIINELGTINGVNTVGNQTFAGYSLADLEYYHMRMTFTDVAQIGADELKQIILNYINDNVLEDFGKSISASQFYAPINQYLSSNDINANLVSVEFSKDGEEYSQSIDPTEIYDLLTLTASHIAIDVEED